MSDTPGAVRKYLIDHPAITVNPVEQFAWADAHDAEDARRAEESDKRAVRLNLMISERDHELAMMRESENLALAAARDVIRLLDEAWTNSDTHPRHAPKTCESCDRVYAAIDALEVRE